MRSKRLLWLAGIAAAVTVLGPGAALAQRRGPQSRPAPPPRSDTARPRPGGSYYRPFYYRPYYYGPRVSFGIGIGYGFGVPYFYAPYYYSPYYYSPYYASWYGWDGYPYYWAAQYPYPYPYGYRYSRDWASARIEVKPRNAQVFIDGYYVGVVDEFDGVFQRLDVPAGAHELAVYLEGYRTYREKTLFRPGAGYHFKAVLEPLPAGAPPEPRPEPQPSATGRDPYQEPPPGERPRTMPIPERRGPEPRLPREQAAGFGTLSMQVQPADAIVTIDGQRWDSPEGGSRLIVQLPAGPHRVEVTKDGFKPYSTTVDVRPAGTETLNVSLPPGD